MATAPKRAERCIKRAKDVNSTPLNCKNEEPIPNTSLIVWNRLFEYMGFK